MKEQISDLKSKLRHNKVVDTVKSRDKSEWVDTYKSKYQQILNLLPKDQPVKILLIGMLLGLLLILMFDVVVFLAVCLAVVLLGIWAFADDDAAPKDKTVTPSAEPSAKLAKVNSGKNAPSATRTVKDASSPMATADASQSKSTVAKKAKNTDKPQPAVVKTKPVKIEDNSEADTWTDPKIDEDQAAKNSSDIVTPEKAKKVIKNSKDKKN